MAQTVTIGEVRKIQKTSFWHLISYELRKLGVVFLNGAIICLLLAMLSAHGFQSDTIDNPGMLTLVLILAEFVSIFFYIFPPLAVYAIFSKFRTIAQFAIDCGITRRSLIPSLLVSGISLILFVIVAPLGILWILRTLHPYSGSDLPQYLINGKYLTTLFFYIPAGIIMFAFGWWLSRTFRMRLKVRNQFIVFGSFILFVCFLGLIWTPYYLQLLMGIKPVYSNLPLWEQIFLGVGLCAFAISLAVLSTRKLTVSSANGGT